MTPRRVVSSKLLRATVASAVLAIGAATVVSVAPSGFRPAQANSVVIATPEPGVISGYSSLALDTAGNPVVSYFAAEEDRLKILHCGNPTCTSANNSIVSPDAAGPVWGYTSLALDASGHPVVAYRSGGPLKILHCGNPRCTSGNIITTPDSAFIEYPSLALDPAGNPVVSYYVGGGADLRVLHCGDPNCSAGNSITTPDSDGFVGRHSALAIDASGNPIVSYHDETNGVLKLLRCGTSNCDSGNTITVPHSGSVPGEIVGRGSSVTLDASGNPVISYESGKVDSFPGTLTVLRCGNLTCTAGNTIETPDPYGGSGLATSIALDSSGNPVVSYIGTFAATPGVRVLRCGNPTCNDGNTIRFLDFAAVSQTSMALDGAGAPIVSYEHYDGPRVAHCLVPQCGTGQSTDVAGDVGIDTALRIDANGMPAVSYFDGESGELRVLRCAVPDCSFGNQIASPAPPTGPSTYGTSLELDSKNRPVVSYHTPGTEDLSVLRCGDPSCVSGNSIVAVDSLGFVGYGPSLSLDDASRPVVSYYDVSLSKLKVLRCGNATCEAENVIAIVDSGVCDRTSMALDDADRPIVAYCDQLGTSLRIVFCGDTTCTAGNKVKQFDVSATVSSPSLALDSNQIPVIAYREPQLTPSGISSRLKVLRCLDLVCDNATIGTPDPALNTGFTSSIALDANDQPVISYATGNYPNGLHLRVLRCGSPQCSTGNTISIADIGSSVGLYSSIALDESGNPVIAYRAGSPQEDLKVLHCDTPSCVLDRDADGCHDTHEQGSSAAAGGLRDFKNFWDFFDIDTENGPAAGTHLQGAISFGNVLEVANRFGQTGDPGIDPLSDASGAGYHTRYDRGAQIGANVWNTGPANGAVALGDVLTIAAQFGHSCI